jgi:hypothetical protein
MVRTRRLTRTRAPLSIRQPRNEPSFDCALPRSPAAARFPEVNALLRKCEWSGAYHGTNAKLFRWAAIRFAVWLFASAAVFGRHAPIESTLESTEAVAWIRVTSVTEELRDELIHRHAVLTIIGNSHGLAPASTINVEFGVPSRPPARTVSSDGPFFLPGQRSILLLGRERERWVVLRQIYLSDDDTVAEPEIFRPLGFDRGASARYAVDRLIAMANQPKNKTPPAR